MSEPKIFTLRQVVSSIRKTIEERYQSDYWVKAEMHKLGQTRSGHCYPELVQKEDGKIVAEIRGTIWKQHFDVINARFMTVVKEPLKEDTTLLMRVHVNFHEVYGISLQILDIDPNYSLGELQRERLETLKKLEKEGLLNANQKIEFPLLPKRIAIISAESSKGLSDFMKVIEQNSWGYSFFSMLFPASLQGDQAEHSIIHQLKRIASVRDHFDVVVIVRGGGGEVGMSCYNNFNLCRAIATFPLPVLTGIGHSTNLTVAEMVSYRNAITPTELGDFLIQAFHEFAVPLKESSKSIRIHSKQLLEIAQFQLNKISTTFIHSTRKSLEREHVSISSLQKELSQHSRQNLRERNEHLQKIKQRVGSSGKLEIQKQKNAIDQVHSKLSNVLQTVLVAQSNRIERFEHSVKLMDPVHVLQRGYSITTIGGKTIGMNNPIRVGDQIFTRTATFNVESEVLKLEDNERET